MSPSAMLRFAYRRSCCRGIDDVVVPLQSTMCTGLHGENGVASPTLQPHDVVAAEAGHLLHDAVVGHHVERRGMDGFAIAAEQLMALGRGRLWRTPHGAKGLWTHGDEAAAGPAVDEDEMHVHGCVCAWMIFLFFLRGLRQCCAFKAGEPMPVLTYQAARRT